MMRTTLVVMALVSSVCLLGSTANAQVGEPTGFDVIVRQGSTIIANRSITFGLGGDIVDTKDNDGDPLGFTQIGTLNGPGGQSPVILKVLSGDDAMFRLIHIFIDAPISLTDIDHAGPNSLFNPASFAPIEVSLSNMHFAGTPFVQPMLVPNNTFLTTFLRDEWGLFYEMPHCNAFNAYGHGVNDIQVPGERFLDAAPLFYTFDAVAGSSAMAKWGKIPNPGDGMHNNIRVHNGSVGGLPSHGDGYVFEIGLSVAVIRAPEPSTLLLLASGLAMLIRRRR